MNQKQRTSIIENDVILVYIQNQPAFFARVEKIAADKRKGWWQVTLLILNIPLTTITWIVDDEQIRGDEFTMQGIPVRIERVVAPGPIPEKQAAPDEPGKTATIISLNVNPE